MTLKQLLTRYNISQQQLADRVISPQGKPYSVAVINRIANHGKYPKNADAADIQAQIEAVLVTHNISEKPTWGNNKHKTTKNLTENLEMQMLSQSAKALFNLPKSPFIDDVQGRDDVYLSSEQRYIRQSMNMTAKHGGFMAIVGESGAGKTTLKRDLIEGIAQDNDPVIIIQPQTIDKTRLTAIHICDAIIDDVSEGNETPKRSMEAKARQIKRLLTDSSRAGNKHCLVIDEAHDLTIPTLKHLKRFWELEDGMKRLLAIVLIGQPELKVKLNERNADVREVARRCEQVELQPLNAYVGEYLKHKFNRVGKAFNEVFADDAMGGLTTRLTQTTGKTTVSLLYPLIVNNAVIVALNEAAKLGQDKITADIFEGV